MAYEQVAVLERAPRRDERPSVHAHARDASATQGPRRVIVVANNQLLRDALERALDATTGLVVIGTAESPEDLPAAMFEVGMADVLLMDLAPSRERTLARMRELTAASAHLKIIVIDVVHDGVELLDLLEAGASALLLKRATVDEILRTTWAVLGGASVIPQSVTSSMLALIGARGSQAEVTDWRETEITRREHQIIVLIADGLSNKEIATKLNIATFTVKSHVHNVLQKLGMQTRAQIARYFLLGQTTRLRPDSAPLAIDVNVLRPNGSNGSNGTTC